MFIALPQFVGPIMPPDLANSITTNKVIHRLKKEGKTLDAAKCLNPKTITRSFTKIGRNSKCPCGSGKKYKKCCI